MRDNWVVMPVRNCRWLTGQAIRSILASDIPVRILVVNNGSTDGTPELLRTLDERVQTVHFYPQQPSVAKTWNDALKYLFNKVGLEHAWVVNNDIIVRPDAYKLLLADGGGFVSCIGVDPAAWDEKGYGKPAMARSPHPDFSCFLIRRWVWQRVGPFDEGYLGGYYEDNQYHVRLHRAGVRAYAIDVPFAHWVSSTVKSMPRIEAQLLREQAHKNGQLFKKEFGCLPTETKGYDRLFDESSFGVDAHVTPMAKPHEVL